MTESKEIWDSLFPGRAKVQWKAFFVTFERYFKAKYPPSSWTPVKTERLLKYSIALEDSFVTTKTFDNFVKLFGPIQSCLVKVYSNLFDEQGILHPWYHGPLTRGQSSSLLSHRGVGSFLVRLSEHKAGNFTIVYVTEDGSLKNVLVYNHMDGGYGLDPRPTPGKQDGRSFLNIPEFLALHPLKLRHPLESSLFETCHREGPALDSHPPSPRDETPAPQEEVTSPVVADDPYGMFEPGEESVDMQSSGKFGQLSPSSSQGIASGMWSQASVMSDPDPIIEDCYGTFDPEDAAPVFSTSLSHSQSERRSESEHMMYANDPRYAPEKVHRANTVGHSSWGQSRGACMGAMPSRSELKGMLDESCHKEREGELDTALGIANNVYDIVKNYVNNLRELRTNETQVPETELTSSSSTDSLASVPSEDLGLLAKTLQQRGDIQKAMCADVEVYLQSYIESYDILRSLWERVERSDSTRDADRFKDYQPFSRLNRQLAKIYLELKDFKKAVYHFSEELAMLLLDSDFSSRENAVAYIKQMKYALESYQTTVHDEAAEFCNLVNASCAQDLLNRGIAEFSKGSEHFDVTYELLCGALRSSRCCGEEMIELRALGNIATVESSRNNQFQAIQFYSQCAILCKKLHTDNATLKKILYKQVLCMMKVGQYKKAIECIHQLMAIATSLQNIEKLEELKEKAMSKMGNR